MASRAPQSRGVVTITLPDLVTITPDLVTILRKLVTILRKLVTISAMSQLRSFTREVSSTSC